MGCPQCQSDDYAPSGVCPICGYMAAGNRAVPEPDEYDDEDLDYSGMTDADYSGEMQEPVKNEERPQWRKELSERLAAIKQKREGADQPRQTQNNESALSARTQASSAMKPIELQEKPIPEVPAHRLPPKPKPPAPKQKTLQPVSFQAPTEEPPRKEADPQEVQKLIDNVVLRKTSLSGESELYAGSHGSAPEQLPDSEGKLILLSRTLSGLVDLIIVILCPGVFIIAADLFSGIIALDAVSYLAFAALFLMTHFFYSLFFLATANQTIGMMIVDLRVVDAFEGRPMINQLLRRCFAFLASVLGLGFGLIWSLFDRDSLCFHDRISDTRVVRF